MAWRGVVWCGVCGVVWCGVVWCGVVRCGVGGVVWFCVRSGPLLSVIEDVRAGMGTLENEDLGLEPAPSILSPANLCVELVHRSPHMLPPPPLALL